MLSEKRLVEEVEEFFNEEDTSVGLYAIGKVDENVMEGFKTIFDDVNVVSYDANEIRFKVMGNEYVVALSSSYEQWKMYKVI